MEEEEEEEGELERDKESPPRSPLLTLDSCTTVSMAGERSSAGKNWGIVKASGQVCGLMSWECSSRETFLHLCRVQ